MGVTVRHNKREVIARVDKEYRALDRIVRRLGAKGLEEDVPAFGARARIRRERWSRKDALAHVVEIDRKNRVLYERWHDRPARDVVAYHRAVHRDVARAMRALPPAYFAKRLSPYWPNDLVGHSAEHRRRHLETTMER